MAQLTNQQKAYLLAFTAVLFWSTVPTAFKLGLRFQDNFQMVSGAAIISTIVLGITLIIQGKLKLFKSIDRKDILRAAALGILNPAVYYIVLFKAYDLLPAQVAQPLNMTWPIVLVLISIPILRQKIGWLSILSLIISFFGVIILSLQGGAIFEDNSNYIGIILALASALLWAFYWIFNMKTRIDDVLGLFLVFSFSTIYLLIAGLVRKPGLPVGLEAWTTAAYIGVFEMGLSFVFWLTALNLSLTTAKISNLVFLAPFINLLFVHMVLGESIYISTIFGIILVLTGIVFQNIAQKKNVPARKNNIRN